MHNKYDIQLCYVTALLMNIIAVTSGNDIIFLCGCLFWCTGLIIERLDK